MFCLEWGVILGHVVGFFPKEFGGLRGAMMSPK